MLKGVVVQELKWELYEAIPQSPSSPSKGVYCMTSDKPGRKGQGRV